MTEEIACLVQTPALTAEIAEYGATSPTVCTDNEH